MTTRIAEAIAETLDHSRRILFSQYANEGGRSILDAIVILAHAECAVRIENSQN